MPTLLCICTAKVCGHKPGERCGNPINENHAKPYINTDTGLQETGGWICDECWGRVNPEKSN